MSSLETLPDAPRTNESEEKEPDMAIFRAEIASLIEERKPDLEKLIASVGMRDLLFVNPDELTIEDARMWEMVRDKPALVTPEKFDEYTESTESSNIPSRKSFRAALGNKLFPHFAIMSIKKHS